MQDDWSYSARSLDEDFGLAPAALPRPRPGYLVCSTAWLTRVLPVVRTPDQLAVALLLYRQCLRKRSRTVAFSNGDLAELGISRQTTAPWITCRRQERLPSPWSKKDGRSR